MIKKIAVKSVNKKSTSNISDKTASVKKAVQVATPVICKKTAINLTKKITISAKNQPSKHIKTAVIKSISIKPAKKESGGSNVKHKTFSTSVKSQSTKVTPAKKTVVKTVAQKKTAKKASCKKTVTIFTSTSPKSSVKNTATKINVPVVLSTPDVAPKKEEPRKTKGGKKPHIRPSDSIVFTLEDLDTYLEMRASGVTTTQSKSAPTNSSGKIAPQKGNVAPAPIKATSSPKNPIAAASIFDILGFNPVETPSLEKHQEKEVPRKWKKYYNLLVNLRKHHSSGAESISQEVLKRSAKEDSGDLSSYGQHLADAGSESFERDIAYNLLSNEKEILAEIDAAIERIKNGTYGICEITGQPIPESRLESIPFTRCTKEGQEIKENESKKIKSVQRSIYDISDTVAATEEEES